MVSDGLTKTFAIGERHIPPADLTAPLEIRHHLQGDAAFHAGDTSWGIFADTARGLANSRLDQSRSKYGSEHSSVTLFVYLDGHVSSIQNESDLDILRSLCLIADDSLADPEEGWENYDCWQSGSRNE